VQAYMEGLQLSDSWTTSLHQTDKMDAGKLSQEKQIRIIVKPNAKETKIIGIDEARNALRVDVAAPADKDKANKEVIKFFSRLLKKRVGIAHGLRSKEKILRVMD